MRLACITILTWLWLLSCSAASTGVSISPWSSTDKSSTARQGLNEFDTWIDDYIPSSVNPATTDISPYLWAALTNSSFKGVIRFGPKTYYLASSMTQYQSFRCIGSPGYTVLAGVQGTTSGGTRSLVLCNTNIGSGVTIANASQGDTNLTLLSPSNLSPGSWCVVADTQALQGGNNTDFTNCELVQVCGTNGLSVYLSTPLCHAFLSSASATLTISAGATWSFDGITFSNANIFAQFVPNFSIRNCSFVGEPWSCVNLEVLACANPEVSDNRFLGISTKHDQSVGIVVGNCFRPSLSRNRYYYMGVGIWVSYSYYLTVNSDNATLADCGFKVSGPGSVGALFHDCVAVGCNLGYFSEDGGNVDTAGEGDTNTVWMNCSALQVPFGGAGFVPGGVGSKILNCYVQSTNTAAAVANGYAAQGSVSSISTKAISNLTVLNLTMDLQPTNYGCITIYSNSPGAHAAPNICGTNVFMNIVQRGPGNFPMFWFGTNQPGNPVIIISGVQADCTTLINSNGFNIGNVTVANASIAGGAPVSSAINLISGLSVPTNSAPSSTTTRAWVVVTNSTGGTFAIPAAAWP